MVEESVWNPVGSEQLSRERRAATLDVVQFGGELPLLVFPSSPHRASHRTLAGTVLAYGHTETFQLPLTRWN